VKEKPNIGSSLKFRAFLSEHIPKDRQGCELPVPELHVNTTTVVITALKQRT